MLNDGYVAARRQAPARPARPRNLAGVAGGIDWALVVATLALCVLGALSVYAATRDSLVMAGRSGTAYLQRDLVNVAIGAVLAAPAALIDYRSIRAYAWVVYGGVMVLLLAVLSPLGSTINGAHAWFDLGALQLEPSEFAKLAVILLAASLLAERDDNESTPPRRDIVLALVVIGLPLLLILAEPALGIAIVIAVAGLTVLTIAGVRARVTAGLLGAAVVLGVLVFQLHLLKPYQEQRFTYFADQSGTRTTTGYQIEQSKIAIGSGHLTGKGFLDGTQTNGKFIPEQQTDFVFTVGAEEGGFVGAGLILVALGALLWRGVTVAERAADPFGKAVAGGIVMWFAFQSFTNIGMTMGIMPVTGLPLPFVSYGGSAMFVDLIAVALLLNIHARSRRAGLSFL